MNNNPIISYAIALHQNLQKKLAAVCNNTCSEQVKKLETAMQVCNNALAELYSLIPKEGFESIESEILFFKIIKPLFVVEREYLQRIYHGRLFTDETVHFWTQELVRMEKLLSEHHEFVTYYYNGETYNDYAWFSQGQPPLPTALYLSSRETNLSQTCARGGWIAGLIAVERYRDWLATKINQLEKKE